MEKLERRIERLEAASHTDDDLTIIIVGFGKESDPARLTLMKGAGVWDRLPGETPEAFRERARVEARATGKPGPLVFIERSGPLEALPIASHITKPEEAK